VFINFIIGSNIPALNGKVRRGSPVCFYRMDNVLASFINSFELLSLSVMALTGAVVVVMQRQQRIQRERLVDEFSKALTSFQDAQRQEKVKEKQSNVRANRPPSASYVSQFMYMARCVW